MWSIGSFYCFTLICFCLAVKAEIEFFCGVFQFSCERTVHLWFKVISKAKEWLWESCAQIFYFTFKKPNWSLLQPSGRCPQTDESVFYPGTPGELHLRFNSCCKTTYCESFKDTADGGVVAFISFLKIEPFVCSKAASQIISVRELLADHQDLLDSLFPAACMESVSLLILWQTG